MRTLVVSAVCGLALCAAAPASAAGPEPETLYSWVTAHKSVGLVWSFADMGRMNVSVDCNDRHWYKQRGPAVNAANHFRMRFKGKIAGVPGARQNPDGSTEVIPAPPKAKMRLYGGWPTPKRARIYIKHSKCFPHGKRLTLRSRALP